MAITVKCRCCGALHDAGHHVAPALYPFCGPECERQFERTVERLVDGVPLEIVGCKPGSRLHSEALKEISQREARALWQQRDELVREYLETRPRRREPVVKRYFSF